jgi:hypothetical protein
MFRPDLPETAAPTRLLGCERPYLQIAQRSLRTGTGSGTTDAMQLAFVEAEATGDKVAVEGYQRRQDENRFA